MKQKDIRVLIEKIADRRAEPVNLLGSGKVFFVPSESAPGWYHIVVMFPGGVRACDCPGFKFDQGGKEACKHIDLVLEWI